MYCIVTVVRFVIILIKFYVCMYIVKISHEDSTICHFAPSPRTYFAAIVSASVGPMVWNSPSDNIRDPALSNSSFGQLLNTDLFNCYSNNSAHSARLTLTYRKLYVVWKLSHLVPERTAGGSHLSYRCKKLPGMR